MHTSFTSNVEIQILNTWYQDSSEHWTFAVWYSNSKCYQNQKLSDFHFGLVMAWKPNFHNQTQSYHLNTILVQPFFYLGSPGGLFMTICIFNGRLKKQGWIHCCLLEGLRKFEGFLVIKNISQKLKFFEVSWWRNV